MLRCRLKCNDANGRPLKAVSHFHCFTCARIFERTESLTNHLYNHKRETLRNSETIPDTPIETPRNDEDELCTSSNSNADKLSYECETCFKHFSSKKYFRNHVKYIHFTTDYINANRFLHGVCVDPRQGLYLVRRSFSGTSHPIHVLHSFGVDGGFLCELDECREISKTARRSGNPNFMCCHLKSVQYVSEPFKTPPAMSRNVLEELIGQVKWLKQSREQECLEAQAVAESSKAPLVVEFSNSKTSLLQPGICTSQFMLGMFTTMRVLRELWFRTTWHWTSGHAVVAVRKSAACINALESGICTKCDLAICYVMTTQWKPPTTTIWKRKN